MRQKNNGNKKKRRGEKDITKTNRNKEEVGEGKTLLKRTEGEEKEEGGEGKILERRTDGGEGKGEQGEILKKRTEGGGEEEKILEKN